MNNRIKLKTTTLNTRTGMELLVREIAGLKLNEQLLNASLDAELQAVRDSYSARFNTLAEALSEKLEAARIWAEANPAEFARRRSIEFTHGSIGFRTGAPKLKTLAKRKWDGVLQELRGAVWGAAYIRVKEEVNKEQIIADISMRTLSEADLRQAGARVVQEELFFVDTKLTQTGSRQSAQVA